MQLTTGTCCSFIMMHPRSDSWEITVLNFSWNTTAGLLAAVLHSSCILFAAGVQATQWKSLCNEVNKRAKAVRQKLNTHAILGWRFPKPRPLPDMVHMQIESSNMAMASRQAAAPQPGVVASTPAVPAQPAALSQGPAAASATAQQQPRPTVSLGALRQTMFTPTPVNRPEVPPSSVHAAPQRPASQLDRLLATVKPVAGTQSKGSIAAKQAGGAQATSQQPVEAGRATASAPIAKQTSLMHGLSRKQPAAVPTSKPSLSAAGPAAPSTKRKSPMHGLNPPEGKKPRSTIVISDSD